MKAEELKMFNSTATAVTLSEQRFSLASFRLICAFSMPSLLQYSNIFVVGCWAEDNTILVGRRYAKQKETSVTMKTTQEFSEWLSVKLYYLAILINISVFIMI